MTNIDKAVRRAKGTSGSPSGNKADEAKRQAAANLPKHYEEAGTKVETRPLIELEDQFIEALPGEDVVPGRGQDYIIRNPSNYVDVPVDPNTGEPRVDFRFGSDTIPGRREKNMAKGYRVAMVKNRKLVPPGTPGAHPVQVGGATLLVRRREVADKARTLHEEFLRDKLNSHSKTEAGARAGIEITDDSTRPVIVGGSDAGREPDKD